MKLLLGRDPRFAQTALNGLFSLGFAVLIWAAVGARISSTATFRVPFELRVPAEVAVEYRDPYAPPGDRPTIEVTVRGPNEVLSKLNPNEIQGIKELQNLDEASIDKGLEQDIEVGAASFRTAAKGIEIVSASLDRIKVAISRLGRKTYRVKEDVPGKPAAGFRVTAVLPDPDVVGVTGPRALLLRNPGPFKLEAVDVRDERKNVTSFVKVLTPDGLIPEDRVRVTVVIEPEPQEREFEFAVQLLTTPEVLKPTYQLDPPVTQWKARVLVKGPLEALNSLEARLAALKGLPGEPFAFLRLTGPLELGQTNGYVEVANLPRELTYTKTRFEFAVKEPQK